MCARGTATRGCSPGVSAVPVPILALYSPSPAPFRGVDFGVRRRFLLVHAAVTFLGVRVFWGGDTQAHGHTRVISGRSRGFPLDPLPLSSRRLQALERDEESLSEKVGAGCCRRRRETPFRGSPPTTIPPQKRKKKKRAPSAQLAVGLSVPLWRAVIHRRGTGRERWRGSGFGAHPGQGGMGTGRAGRPSESPSPLAGPAFSPDTCPAVRSRSRCGPYVPASPLSRSSPSCHVRRSPGSWVSGARVRSRAPAGRKPRPPPAHAVPSVPAGERAGEAQPHPGLLAGGCAGPAERARSQTALRGAVGGETRCPFSLGGEGDLSCILLLPPFKPR